jgi:hypothetical protein
MEAKKEIIDFIKPSKNNLCDTENHLLGVKMI